MAADFSRVRHNPLLDWAGVELKQGAVLLDADANELVAVLDRRLRALASDVLGRSTVSGTTPDAFRITLAAGLLEIGRGRLYVDGLLAENHGGGASEFDALLGEPRFVGATALAAQPYVPIPVALPTSGRHLVYLDVWQREVTHLEMPALVESAVNVETSSRLQTVWQVKLLQGIGSDAACGSELAAWNALTAPSAGRLTTGTFAVPPGDDPCELPPSGGFRGLENQLYRVEIHDAGQPGVSATFKWSRENASVGSRVTSVISATELELASLGRDEVLGIATGDWVEVLDDRREFALQAGEMRKVSVPDPTTRRISFSQPLPADMLPAAFPDSTQAAARNLRVRRWDQRGRILRPGIPGPIQDLDAAGSTGVIRVPAAGTAILIEHGVTVSFASLGAAGFKVGDHWEFAARTADASVEELVAAPPRGIHHHYARLGLWDVAAGAVTDCRTPWPPTSQGGDCSCTQCVTPESHAKGLFTIQDAVNRVRDTGGTVCLRAGLYSLSEPVRIAAARSVAIRGQGAATVITASGTAFQIEGAIAIVVEKLSVISLGLGSAITATTVAGLRLSELALVVMGNRDDGQGAGVGLSGLCAGVAIRDNLIVAADGIRSEGKQKERVPLVLTAALQVRDNVLWCRRRGLSLEGTVAHMFGHRIEDNELVGCADGGLVALGFALPGASMRMCGNTLNVHGQGIVSGVDGTWIEGNKLHASRVGGHEPRGSAIVLAKGMDPTGSDQAHVLANQVSGFAAAGISIEAPVQELICKLNIIEGCGAGILMTDDGEAGSVSIENNHLRDILGLGAVSKSGLCVGIGVSRTTVATVVGNQIRRVAIGVSDAKAMVGILMMGVERSRIHGNEIGEIGPLKVFNGIGAGIMVRSPYEEADIAQNRVNRDSEAASTDDASAWVAVLVGQEVEFGRLPTTGSAIAVARMAHVASVRLDEKRTLILSGDRAVIRTARSEFTHTVGTPGTVSLEADVRRSVASVQGNSFAARGRLPAVMIVATGEALFSDNRCTQVGLRPPAAVEIHSPVALVHANRVRGGEVSISLAGSKSVAVLGNVTTGRILLNNGALPAPWAPLNING